MTASAGMYSGHAIIFPFMAKGHMIPHLQLARLLFRNHNLAVTVITTPANRSFCETLLTGTSVSVVSIPFPSSVPHVPEGVESTDRLPNLSSFAQFAEATQLMQPAFESTLRSLLPVSFIISDGFLPWTYDSALSFSVPRYAFYGVSNYAFVIHAEFSRRSLLQPPLSDDEPFILPSFPWIQLTPNDFDHHMRYPHLDHHYSRFTSDAYQATLRSQGLIVNSFRELEPVFLDHWNNNFGPKAVCVGPLCMTEEGKAEAEGGGEEHRRWLDQKAAEGKTVVYVSFGSQADMSVEQMEEIAAGLEEAGVSFLWAMKKGGEVVGEEYEERVRGRGVVARGWVNQGEVLSHGSVGVFVSHCGWGSVMEAVCSGVVVAAFPVGAEQHVNARMVVELGMGVRVETVSGSVRGLVSRDGLKKALRELMEGEKGKDARKKVASLRLSAIAAVSDGGSSSTSLTNLVLETCHHV